MIILGFGPRRRERRLRDALRILRFKIALLRVDITEASR